MWIQFLIHALKSVVAYQVSVCQRSPSCSRQLKFTQLLTHWGQVTHICVGKLTSIASDNGLSPGRRQVIIWNIAGIMLIRPLGTNFSEILIEIQTFSLKKIRLKMSSAKCRPFCLGLDVLTHCSLVKLYGDVGQGQHCLRQLTIAWDNVDPDLCHHMASPSHYIDSSIFD